MQKLQYVWCQFVPIFVKSDRQQVFMRPNLQTPKCPPPKLRYWNVMDQSLYNAECQAWML